MPRRPDGATGTTTDGTATEGADGATTGETATDGGSTTDGGSSADGGSTGSDGGTRTDGGSTTGDSGGDTARAVSGDSVSCVEGTGTDDAGSGEVVTQGDTKEGLAGTGAGETGFLLIGAATVIAGGIGFRLMPRLAGGSQHHRVIARLRTARGPGRHRRPGPLPLRVVPLRGGLVNHPCHGEQRHEQGDQGRRRDGGEGVLLLQACTVGAADRAAAFADGAGAVGAHQSVDCHAVASSQCGPTAAP